MVRTLTEDFGNPSSVHYHGQQAKSLIDDARASVAALIDADPADVIFTSGGTEADNLALRGALAARPGRHAIVTSAIEHEAVLTTARALAKQGAPLSLVAVDASAVVDPDAVRAAITPETAVVSVMHANNEVGTIQPILDVARAAREAGAWFHTDAVQSAGRLPISARAWAAAGVDLIAISSHKIGGPKGVGALWIRRGVTLGAILTGGRHERNRRAGTENVPGIVGFGAAARDALAERDARAARERVLRDALETGLAALVPDIDVNGDPGKRLPNTANISFSGVEAESLLIALDLEGISVSTGAACSSGTLEPSHVLQAMGLPRDRTRNSIRFSLGPETTAGDIDRVLAVLPPIVDKLRRLTGAATARRAR